MTSVPEKIRRGRRGDTCFLSRGVGSFNGWGVEKSKGGLTPWRAPWDHFDFKMIKTKYNFLGQSFISKVKYC